MIAFPDKFYVTTSIAYVNAAPHIGFALEVVQADATARWHAQLGENIFFLTGTDEHGVKLYKLAQAERRRPIEIADKNAAQFKALTPALHLSNNSFIRTSDAKVHWPGAQQMWKLLEQNGDIYKKKYKGCYCPGCESFITKSELVNGKCPLHPSYDIEVVEEENYFFRLSRYEKQLKQRIQSGEYTVLPEKRRREVLAFINSGLQDVSFSRESKKMPWGIPVPTDKDHVMYVWCDALTNYLTGIGYPKDSFTKWWPADLHCIGKDISRFHAVIWPAMLISADLPLPKALLVHGFITSSGQKMSKSIGNVVNPFVEVEKYGADAVRYFLLREFPYGDDGDYSTKAIVARINSELADDLGNLVSRSLTLIEKFNKGKIPRGKLELKPGRTLDKANKLMQNFEFHRALEEIWVFINECNNYVQKKQPWKLHKEGKSIANILFTLAESLRWISSLCYPFIPKTSEEIAKKIGLKKVPTFSELKKAKIKYGLRVKVGEMLFKKIDLAVAEKPKTKMEVKKMIDFSEFEKVDLRVGKIERVEEVQGADKLFKMQVDFGQEKRQVIAGIKPWYRKDDLLGRKAIFVVNLKPAKIKGLDSEAMILAAEHGKKVVFIEPEKDIELGAKIH